LGNSPDEEGTAAAKRGRGGQTTTILSIAKMAQWYDLPALTSFGRLLLVGRGILPAPILSDPRCTG